MIYISKASDGSDVINLTIGDDASFTLAMTNDSGEPYVMGEGEYLIFGLREQPTADSPLLLEIRSDGGSNVIEFTHADTAELQVGAYSAEVQLMMSTGKRYTVWPKLIGNSRTSKSNRKNFVLMTEVVV